MVTSHRKAMRDAPAFNCILADTHNRASRDGQITYDQ